MNDDQSILFGIVRNIQDKKKQKTIIRNVGVENENNKGITNYQPSDIEAFFPSSEPIGNYIISGGSSMIRLRTLFGAVDSALRNSFGVVIIHSNNSALETEVSHRYHNSYIFSKKASIYDPLLGLSDPEIIHLIQSSATKMCPIQNNGLYFLQGVTSFIRSKKVKPYCGMYITCPFLDIIDKIDESETKGYVDHTTATKIKTYLIQGQPQKFDIENFFNTLDFQGRGLLASKTNLCKSHSIKDVVTHHGLAVIDIGSPTNDLLINLVFGDILGAMAYGKPILIVVDSIPASSSEKIDQVLRASNPPCFALISSDDVFSMLNGDENLFALMIGKSKKIAIFSHQSGISCNKWSEVLGYYEKQDISSSFSYGTNYRTMFSIVPGQMSNQGINISKKNDFIVRPESIRTMKQNETYIIDSNNSEIAHFLIK